MTDVVDDDKDDHFVRMEGGDVLNVYTPKVSNQKSSFDMSTEQKETEGKFSNNAGQSSNLTYYPDMQPMKSLRGKMRETLIDFKQEFTDYRNRTESTQSYTIMQCADVMFIKKNKLVSLDYIFYQKDQKLQQEYTKIKKKAKGNTSAERNLLKGEEFIRNSDERDDNRAWQKAPIVFGVSKAQSEDPTQIPFLDTKNQDATVEALLSLWKVDADGQLLKDREVSFTYSSQFKPSQDHTEMRLKLSNDKKMLFLPVVTTVMEEDYCKKSIQLLAWNTKNLTPVQFPHKLQENLEYVHESPEENQPGKQECAVNFEIKSISLVAECKYLLVKLFFEQSLIFHIYSVTTGDRVLMLDNQACSNQFQLKNLISPKAMRDFMNVQRAPTMANNTEQLNEINEQSLSCIDLLVDEYSPEDQEEADEEDKDQQESSEGEDSQKEDDGDGVVQGFKTAKQVTWSDLPDDAEQARIPKSKTQDMKSQYEFQRDDGNIYNVEGGEEEDEQDRNPTQNELNLIFFFAADFQTNDGKWAMCQYKTTLQELLKSNNTLKEQAEYIKAEGIRTLVGSFRNRQHMPIPSSWFLSDRYKDKQYIPQLWSGYIEITKTSDFNFVGMLNKQKGVYLGYIKRENDSWEEFVKEYIRPQTDAQITRNQQTKEYLMLTIRVLGAGCSTHVFFGEDVTREPRAKAINYTRDHFHAYMDCQILSISTAKRDGSPKKEQDLINDYQSCCLQGCSITEGDQEIYLKTMVQQLNVNGEMVEKIMPKASKMQMHQGYFPIMMYNIGLKKFIIQLYIRQGRQLIYELPKKYKFISFVKFNRLCDLGFNPEGLKFEACCNFVFLTQEERTKRVFVNLMLIDPYHEQIQISLFTSSSFFDFQKNPKLNDQNFESIMYQSGNSIKLIQQYATFLETFKLRDEIDGEEVQESESEEDGNKDDDEEGQTEIINQVYEKVPITLSKSGRIYYVVSYDGQCTVKEISPHQDFIHKIVFEIKSKKCYGFVAVKNFFYFIDEYKIVNKLKRFQETGQLVEVDEFYVKKKERSSLQFTPYQRMVVTDRYLVIGPRIFYTYSKTPLEDGIQDMELLTEPDTDQDTHEKRFASGVYIFNGSDQFVCVYNSVPIAEEVGAKVETSFKYTQTVYQFPDSQKMTLVNSKRDFAKMSTFLEDGKVLVQIDHRYIIVDQNGNFVNQAKFSDVTGEEVQPRKQWIGKHRNSEGVVEDKYEQIDSHNRMLLKNMSDDNRYFLFEDRLKREFVVYTLESQCSACNVADSKVKNSILQQGIQSRFTKALFRDESQQQDQNKNQKCEDHDDDYLDYSFVFFQKFDIFQCNKYKNFESREYENNDKDNDQIYYDMTQLFNTGGFKMNVLNDGKVIVDFETSGDDIKDTLVDVMWTVFEKDQPPKFYQEHVQFSESAKKEIYKIIEDEKKELEQKKMSEFLNQKKLPVIFQDWERYKELKSKLEEQENRKFSIINAYIFGDYLFVALGRFVKYTMINDEMLDTGKMMTSEMRDLDAGFNQNTEIYAIINTSEKHIVQIIAKDNSKDVLLVINWDLKKNMEFSMFQMEIKEGQSPEFYIAKGMNQKMNYFIDQAQIFDLEYNIPLQMARDNKNFFMKESINVPCLFDQQRKIFEDSSRYLDISKPNIMNFPLNRIDLLFWMNISEKGSNTQTIVQSTTLEMFNQIFSGYSLFHHFYNNVDLIKELFNELKETLDEEDLTLRDKNMPLVILNPDNYGKTALEWAIERKRPRVFELLLSFLATFDRFSVTKMMLKSFQRMVNYESDMILQFFNTAIYKPILLEEPIISWWPQEQEDFIFVSPTSIINSESLMDVLNKNELINLEELTEQEENRDQSQFAEEEQELPNSQQLRSKKLDFTEDDVNVSLQRLVVEALDFDWIFEGENTKNLILMLADSGRKDLYVAKSFKTFITLMWRYYKPKIRKFIFFPFVVYMIAFIYMATYSAGGFLTAIQLNELGKEAEGDTDFAATRVLVITLSLICTLMWGGFCYIEWKQMIRDPYDYFFDFWNLIDVIGLVLQIWFLYLIIFAAYFSTLQNIEAGFIRMIGALTVFNFWLKCFYWMRLFDQYAHFLNLVTQTIVDIRTFSAMLIIILCAFANFFGIINKNTTGANPLNRKIQQIPATEADYTYIDDNFENPISNAFISMWLLGLGEFSIDGYGSGTDKYDAWLFFILATFLIMIVFMNMVIAIMTATFAQVFTIQEQNALNEQILMIEDFVWLIDLEELFRDARYIVTVKQDTQVGTKQQDVIEELEWTQQTINQKSDKQHAQMMKRVQSMERNIRSLLKSQQSKIVKIHKHQTELILNQTKQVPN